MRQFTVSGSPFEMGVQTAREFLPYLSKVKEKYERTIQIAEVAETVRKLRLKLEKEYPDAYAEILGRAEGASMCEDAAFLMFFPEIFKRVDGCTTLMLRRNDGAFLLSHNEDDKGYDPANTALVTYDYGDHTITGFTMAEKLTGYAFGWNSYGLLYSSNYIYDTKIDLNQVSRYIMVRDVMNARTIEEAVYRLSRMRVASAFSLNLYDRVQDKAVNVEKDIDAIYVTEVHDRYARANHFTTRKDSLLPEPYVSSAFRDAKVNELIPAVSAETATIEDLQKILAYAEEDYYRCVYKDPNKFPYHELSCTVANFSFDGLTDRILIRDCFDGSRLSIPFRPAGR